MKQKKIVDEITADLSLLVHGLLLYLLLSSVDFFFFSCWRIAEKCAEMQDKLIAADQIIFSVLVK